MTIRDFTHFAVYDGYLYIYNTPDSTSYTLQVTGVELQDELTAVSGRFNLDAELGWGLVYKALEKVAEINGSDLKASTFFAKGEFWKDKTLKKAEKKNKILDKITPYNLT